MDQWTERCPESRPGSVFHDIPITTVPRTLVDVAGRMSFDELAQVCHDAEIRYGVKGNAVLSVLARRPNAPGAAELRQAFGEQGITLSELERAFLRLVESERLPLPVTNKVAHSRYVDCRRPEHWEQDRRRERLARAAGDEFRRYTYNDVTKGQTLMLAELHELLP